MVGQKVTLNGDEWTVDQFAPWSEQYVYLTKPSTIDGKPVEDRNDLIVRPVAVVRRAIELATS